MASQEDIDAFKQLLPSNYATYGWNDAIIGALLDAGKTENSMLMQYWDKVAAETAEFADMSESGSSRSLSTVHKNAVAMAKMYRDLVNKEEEEEEAPTARGIRSRAIVRV